MHDKDAKALILEDLDNLARVLALAPKSIREDVGAVLQAIGPWRRLETSDELDQFHRLLCGELNERWDES